MHPSVKRTYEDATHPFKKHPIFRIHGEDLAVGEEGEFEHAKAHHEKVHGHTQFNPSSLMPLVPQAIEIETPHRKKLEDLAIQITKELWGITDEIEFQACLGPGGG